MQRRFYSSVSTATTTPCWSDGQQRQTSCLHNETRVCKLPRQQIGKCPAKMPGNKVARCPPKQVRGGGSVREAYRLFSGGCKHWVPHPNSVGAPCFAVRSGPSDIQLGLQHRHQNCEQQSDTEGGQALVVLSADWQGLHRGPAPSGHARRRAPRSAALLCSAAQCRKTTPSVTIRLECTT